LAFSWERCLCSCICASARGECVNSGGKVQEIGVRILINEVEKNRLQIHLMTVAPFYGSFLLSSKEI